MSDLSTDTFVRLETAVWDALVRGDPEADAAALSEDFLGVYPTGFATRADHAGQLSDGPTVVEYRIDDAVIRVFSSELVLLAYRAEYRRVAATDRMSSETMFVASLWSKAGEGWVNRFSQDTPAAPQADR